MRRVALTGIIASPLSSRRIIYCGMDDQSGESCLYDRVALRFKGGGGEFMHFP